ncbi:ABC transporter ATP-binding protein [Shuttleworthella satelles]|uniref:ABC transporter, ATP-binding protein n=1 Tax=Shuttleworthella satelles DSM 14600 TaxID=626523 RepID=C4GE09_9FIRM|nr:ABC transporter ATP-binding protein [Shuttleworthia satelles]EEP27261.1 ABC transporter, ATP-binding protein [Shuttleworthia satelles DSM 14600]
MLEISNFSTVYSNGHVAVDNLNLTVEAGDIYAFIGSNGSGKTSTIKAIVGIHDFNGEIIVNGKKVSKNNEIYKKDIAYIPDNPDVYENLTGFQYVNFISDLYEVEKNVRKEKLDYFSNLFEMKAFLSNAISSYSHGMKQKIVIISAFIHSPKLLVMDEPFVGLDPKSSYLLKEEMRKLARGGGAIFFSTHVLEVAEKLCNKIAMIDNGRLIVEGETTEILKNADGLEQYFMEMIKK